MVAEFIVSSTFSQNYLHTISCCSIELKSFLKEGPYFEAAAFSSTLKKMNNCHLKEIMKLQTVAINELLCMKNAGAQIAMDFS